MLGLGACSDDNESTPTIDAPPAHTIDAPGALDAQPASPDAGLDAGTNVTALLESKVDTVVVIYAENRGFDNIYGKFPGANGIPGVSTDPATKGTVAKQVDRDGTTVFDTLPRVLLTGGATGIYQVVPEGKTQVTPDMTGNNTNAMFSMEDRYGVDIEAINEDLWHRFFENQMQLDGGKLDGYVAWADTGSLVMGYFEGENMALWNVAQDFVLADNFFQAAYGGSFLNHQYLVCACAPEWPNADTDIQVPQITALNMNGAAFLPTLAVKMASSVNDGIAPPFTSSAPVAPKNYFGDGKWYGINTLQPPFEPSAGAPDPSADPANSTVVIAAPAAGKHGNVLPIQSHETIGDQLDGKSVSWAWYAGGWTATLTARLANQSVPSSPGSTPNFQFHHQPFNYVQKADPRTADGRTYRGAHLKDETDMVAAAAAGTLEHVVFWKPQGFDNQHPGYTSIREGDQHIADMITALQASPQWPHMVIVVTYDENGGWFDHVAPPKGDLLGPGTRIPALIIADFAKKGTVDHTQYDTASILRLIEKRWNLPPLGGLTARDAALRSNGGVPMGDLTNALKLQ